MDGIADYRFVRALGEGAHGYFYLATPPERLDTPAEFVTVKVLHGATNADGLRRATRELRAFATTSSPYLVNVLDAGRAGDDFFYAMEYCSGGSLAAPASPLSRSQVRAAVADAARGTAAMHAHDLVHRAITPSSVLLTDDGAKLADLGLAHVLRPGVTMTGLGSFAGVEYVEPRLLSGEQPGPATDVWALGATLHRALTGQGIFGDLPSEDPLLAVRRVLSKLPVVSGGLEPADDAIIRSTLDPDVAGRPTAAQLAERLDALA